MIKRIELRNAASFDQKGIILDDLQKLNIIYGGNGTGKTTISRVLADPMRENHYPQCKMKVDNAKLVNLVYNRDFKESNLFEYILGKFALGKEWVMLEKQREAMRPKRDKLSSHALKASEKAWNMDFKVKAEIRQTEEQFWMLYYEPHKDFRQLLRCCSEKTAFSDRLRFEVRQLEWNNGFVTRPHGPWLKELRRRYHELYETKQARNRPKNDTSLDYEREKLRQDFWRFLATQARHEVNRFEQQKKNGKRNSTSCVVRKQMPVATLQRSIMPSRMPAKHAATCNPSSTESTPPSRTMASRDSESNPPTR